MYKIKSIVSIVVIAIFISLFSACGNGINTDTTGTTATEADVSNTAPGTITQEQTTEDGTAESILFDCIIVGRPNESDTQYGYTVIITTQNQLVELYGRQDGETERAVLSYFDSGFFEESIVILLNQYSVSGTETIIDVSKVVSEDGDIKIEITKYSTELSDTGLGGHSRMLILNKNDYNGESIILEEVSTHISRQELEAIENNLIENSMTSLEKYKP